ncbi:MAG: hypothetical protein WD052_10690 [Bacteroidales bacterium]
MPHSKLSSIALYVVAAISLIVILFFYISPKTVDINELDARVQQLQTEGVLAEQPEMETPAEPDSLEAENLETSEEGTEEVAEEDSAAMEAAQEPQGPIVVVAPEDVDLRDHLSNWELMVYKRTDYALRWAYILLAIAAIAAILFPLITIVTDVKAILRLLAVLATAAVLIILSYFAFASDTPISIIGYTGTDNSDPTTLKWIGTGLFTTYIVFGIALVSILYFEVANLFK